MHLKGVTGANVIALISEICHSVSIQGVDGIKGGVGAKRGPWRPLGEGPWMETGDDHPEQEHHYSLDNTWLIEAPDKTIKSKDIFTMLS